MAAEQRVDRDFTAYLTQKGRLTESGQRLLALLTVGYGYKKMNLTTLTGNTSLARGSETWTFHHSPLEKLPATSALVVPHEAIEASCLLAFRC